MDRRPFICPIVASGAHGSGTMHAIGASGPGRGGMTKGCGHLVADFYLPRPSSGDSPCPEPLLPSPYLADPQTNTENTEDGTVRVIIKVTFRLSATIVARSYGFLFHLVLTS